MMPEIKEGALTFAFPEKWKAFKYDDWVYYRKQFIKVSVGVKAIDILALDSDKTCWLIEIKDYRKPGQPKVSDLADMVAGKIRDTLAGLVGAQFRANDESERNAARQALRASDLKVILHVEQPTTPSKLFPQAINRATVLQRLKQLIKAIDPHPRVVDLANMPGIPWTVT